MFCYFDILCMAYHVGSDIFWNIPRFFWAAQPYSGLCTVGYQELQCLTGPVGFDDPRHCRSMSWWWFWEPKDACERSETTHSGVSSKGKGAKFSDIRKNSNIFGTLVILFRGFTGWFWFYFKFKEKKAITMCGTWALWQRWCKTRTSS